MKKLGVLLSGRGSNFEAIAKNIAAGKLKAEIAVVISNRPEAPGLAIAKKFGIKAVGIASKGIEREEFDRQVSAILDEHQVDLVVLAGYMRLLSGEFVRRYRQRIVNIHPSLLPAFPGLDAQHQAFDYGVKVAGCTAHFVEEQLDSGPIILQATVPVLGSDSAESLTARILIEEHRIYSEAIQLVLSGQWRIEGRRVEIREVPEYKADSR